MDESRATTRPGVLWVFVAATVAALTGTRLAGIAVPWFVLTTTHSPTQTGLVAFVEMAPYVVVKALSGPIIDRLGPIPVSVMSALLSMAAVAAVPVLHTQGALSWPALLVLVGLIGALRAPGDGAKTTLIPTVARAGGASLERVSGAYGAVDRLAATLGAVGGTVVIAVVGAAEALWATALLVAIDAVVVGLVLARMTAGHDVRDDDPRRDHGHASYLADLAAGWRFLRGDPVLVAIVAMLAVTNMLEQAFGATLVPVWAYTTGGGPTAIGALFATSAAASVVGAVTAAAYAERLPRRAVYVIAYLLVGVPRFAVLALGLPLVPAMTILAVSGYAAGFINPVLGAVIMERIPGHLMGRVNTLAMACAWALLPVGGLLGGYLVTWVGLAGSLWIVAAAYVIVTLAPTMMPAWGQVDRVTPAAAAPAATAADRPATSRARAATRGRRARSPQP